MLKLKIALIVLILIFFIYIAVSFIVAFTITRPEARHIDISANFIAKEYKDVSFITSDRLTLKGWLLNPEAKKIIILVPGILDNRTSGGYYGVYIAQELVGRGYAVLMYDPRARGESQGSTRLQNEDRDVVAAINFARKSYKTQSIGIIAYSTGALSTLSALKDSQAAAVVLDSTPTFFKDVLESIMANEEGIPPVFLPPVVFFLQNIYRINLGGQSVVSNIPKNTNMKFLILHCKNDTSVPISNSEFLAKNLPNTKFVVFPNGSHIETFKKNPGLYRSIVYKFLDDNIK